MLVIQKVVKAFSYYQNKRAYIGIQNQQIFSVTGQFKDRITDNKN